jgi:predicted DsbA family dithiol-disulfide isomerase
MEPVKLTIYSDMFCPWCYVGQGAVEKLAQQYVVEVTWRPYYLRPDTPPEGMELPPHIKAHMTQTNARLKEMATAAGLPMVFPDRLPNTRLAHEATEYAAQKGKGLEFHRAIFDRYYGRGEDISQWKVIQETANELGLDGEKCGGKWRVANSHPKFALRWMKLRKLALMASPPTSSTINMQSLAPNPMRTL